VPYYVWLAAKSRFCCLLACAYFLSLAIMQLHFGVKTLIYILHSYLAVLRVC
jgi:hypothetical protein